MARDRIGTPPESLCKGPWAVVSCGGGDGLEQEPSRAPRGATAAASRRARPAQNATLLLGRDATGGQPTRYGGERSAWPQDLVPDRAEINILCRRPLGHNILCQWGFSGHFAPVGGIADILPGMV
ncbi:MAG: hypothetical protein EBS68_12110 [Rhodobacteraceae bacterium]|nr:hypothetical protein [Paracoccaceae bacterium]